MSTFTLNAKLERDLNDVSKETGITARAIINTAVKEYIQDLRDIKAAEKVLSDDTELWYTSDEVANELGI